MEIGGPSGGHIDLKGPFSDDFDLRILVNTTSGQINAINGQLDITANTNINLQHQGSTKLQTLSTGVNITGNLEVSGYLQVDGVIKDSSGDAGNSGQILSSTGTGTNWIDNDTGTIDGSGTANDVVMWQDSDTLTDAPIAISGNNATFAGNVIIDGFDNSKYLSLRASVCCQDPAGSGGVGLKALDHSGASADGLGVYGHDGISFFVGQASKMAVSTTGVGVTGDVSLTGSGDKIISAISSDDDATLFLSGAGSGKDTHIVYGGDRDLFISKSSSATATQ